jgi:hypothetical protein
VKAKRREASVAGKLAPIFHGASKNTWIKSITNQFLSQIPYLEPVPKAAIIGANY